MLFYMTQVDKMLFALLRAALGIEEFKMKPTADDWRQLYDAATRQSLLGVCFAEATRQLVPMDVALPWASEAETIRGLNALLNSEAARLTRLFAEAGFQTAILKGQANARLYPDKLLRQPGDIDIWVEGGYQRVVDLCLKTFPGDLDVDRYDYHIQLPADENGVVVEVHYQPSSGNFNPFTNHRLQQWLGTEIGILTPVEEGFNVPSYRFALVMQLAHIQRHFLEEGIGIRQIVDYYWLLNKASADDRKVVGGLLKSFGLQRMAGALMWMLQEVLHLDRQLMLCPPDSKWGERVLQDVMDGGNFGRFAERAGFHSWKRVSKTKFRHLQLLPFNCWEVVCLELHYVKQVARTIPERIKYRTFSLSDLKR